MRTLLLALMLILSITPMASCEFCSAQAQAVGIDVTGAAPGRYMVLVLVNGDGTVHATVLTNVVKVGPGGGGDIPPPDPSPPADPTLTTTIAARAIERVSDRARATNAIKLSLVYSTVASQASALKTIEAMQEAVREGAKAVLGSSLEPWRKWLEPVERHLNQLARDGHMSTLDQVAEQFTQIAKGLETVPAGSEPAEINREFLKKVLEQILEVIIKIIIAKLGGA